MTEEEWTTILSRVREQTVEYRADVVDGVLLTLDTIQRVSTGNFTVRVLPSNRILTDQDMEYAVGLVVNTVKVADKLLKEVEG